MQTISLNKNIYIVNCATIAGEKESQGPYADAFDITSDQDLFGCNNWDEAESFLQHTAVKTLLKKENLTAKDIDYCFAGDLLEESTASSFGLKSFSIPHFGIYGACSTCGEALILASLMLESGHANKVIAVTSSHFASAEVAFRFPLHYGNQRPLTATRTVTGSGAFLLSCDESLRNRAFCKITHVTPGRIVDFDITDSMNMGAAMAPGACSTLLQHFQDLSKTPSDYDEIITGDLGSVGQDALKMLLQKEGYPLHNTVDCGRMIYGVNEEFKEQYIQNHGDLSKIDEQASGLDTNAGGSGCGCSAVMLGAHFLPSLKKHSLQKILFMPTGAMLSKNSFQEGRTIPSIAHALVLEAI